MTANELMVILEQHKKWLNNEDDGICANLRGADLRDAILRYTYLSGADLRGVDLRGANLRGAILDGTDLRGADLRDANLCDADLSGANLRGANLRRVNLDGAYLVKANLTRAILSSAYMWGADLRDAILVDADLRYAILRYADLRDADLTQANLRNADLCDAQNLPELPWTIIVPETGSFVGWKKVCAHGMSVIIKLEILADAKRCNATGRKCRCSAAKVLEIQKLDGTPAGLDSVTNTSYTPHVTYKVGETVLPDRFDDDRWNECSHGIHFFIMRQEAVDY